MAQERPFVNLHNHTDFSKLDGMETVDEVVKFAAADDQPAVAITDHGNMSGYIKLEQACAKAGLRAIPGIEAYYVEDVARSRESRDSSRNHLVLFGVNEDGYSNLLTLSSRAQLEGYYYQPLMDERMLADHTKGLVMTSGCLGSPINQALLRGDTAEATEIMARHRDMMDPGHYFAEIQVHTFDEQRTATRTLVPIAKDLGIPLVAAQDAHYTHAHKAVWHEHMLAMQTGATLSDARRFQFASHTNFMVTSAQAREMFPEDAFPGAYDNTLLIAEMAQDVPLQAGTRYLIPKFADADAYGGEQQMLLTKVNEGIERLYGARPSDEVKDRVARELRVIHDMGFDAYFLIVWDMIAWARSQGIRVGPGRGSAAGSIVSYALGITQLDPLHYGLFFERFLNPGRKSMPDIDIDFERDRRGEVRSYVQRKYGEEFVAYIATQGTFHGRSAIKAAARIHEIEPKAAQAVSNAYPKITKLRIEQILTDERDRPRADDATKDDELYDMWAAGDDFRALLRRNPDLGTVVASAVNVEGYIQNFGVHAAGVLITPEPLTRFVPLTRGTGKLDLPVCGYDKVDVEDIGGLKMDLLGLVNLTTIKQTLEHIEARTGKRLDIDNVPLDDPATFQLLQRADTAGVFQLSSSGMKELLRRVYPTEFADLSAVLALYRPGPMGTDMHLQYADRKNGRERITVDHPDMMEILGETAGVLVYQEQLLALAQKFGGFTASEADTLRKATGKKDAALLAAQEEKFKTGVVRQGYPASLAEKLWAKIPSFAAYSFNKSHSAAYAMVSYQTAYLKANYTADYAAACVDTLPDTSAQLMWARSSGITFEVPDVNESLEGTRPLDERRVRLGLARIKGVGHAACEAVVSERGRGGPFRSVPDFLTRAAGTKKINKAAIVGLIEAGALDSLNRSRGALLQQLPDLMAQAKKAVPKESWSMAVDDDLDLLGDIEAPIVDIAYDAQAPETMALSHRISTQAQRLEVFVGTHPLGLFQKHFKRRIPRDAEVVSAELELGECMIYGVLTSVEVKPTRRSTLTTLTLEAQDGYALQVKLFGAEADLSGTELGSLVLVTGLLQEDEWGKAQAIDAGGDDIVGDEAPREFMGEEYALIPLAALNNVSEDTKPQVITIFVRDAAGARQVASALRGKVEPGVNDLVMRLGNDTVDLPYSVKESAAQLREILADVQGVEVEDGGSESAPAA